MIRNRDSIAFRLLVSVFLIGAGFTLFLSATQIYLDYQHGVSVIESRLADIEKGYVGKIGENLWRHDEEQLRTELEGILQLPDIETVDVRKLAGNGAPIEVRAGHRSDTSRIVREFPIVHRIDGTDHTIGVLHVEATLANLYHELAYTSRIILIGQGVRAFLVAFFSVYILSRLVTRHLAAIAKQVANYSPDRPMPPLTLQRAPRQHEDELGSVVSAFNAMYARLQDTYESLRRANAELEQENAERRRVEEALRASDARLRRLVESNIIGIFFWDMAGKVTDANDAFLATVGYTREDLLAGKINWAAFTPSEYRVADHRAVSELMRYGACTPYEKEWVRKDGERVPVLVGGAFFEGSKEQGIAFFLDMTARKQAETERAARLVAEAANRSKGIFLASMSHELRTPLNGILGYAQILRRDKALGEKQLAGLAVIQQSGEHLLTLINDILDFAKIEAGKQELVAADFALPGLLQSIAGIIGIKAEKKNLNFRCDFPVDLPRYVRGDEKRLRQVLLHLLSNAIKFTDRGEVLLRLRYVSSARARFEVQDTGIGINQNQIVTLFMPFEQAGDIHRRGGGSGLGLAMSRQLVRLMGGDIQVESRVDEGSVFRFEVELPSVESIASGMSQQSTVSGYEGVRRKILVIDDVAENRRVVEDVLTHLGFDMRGAEDAVAGLAAAHAWRPDLIFMDVVMPGMNGLQAIDALRHDAVLANIPVIAISASATDNDQKASFAAGADAFLSKPIDFDMLLARIGSLLGLIWTYEELQSTSLAKSNEKLSIVIPPPDDMTILYQLARLGNMQEIARYAAQLALRDERYRLFCERLHNLARKYESKAVLELVRQHLATEGVPRDAAKEKT